MKIENIISRAELTELYNANSLAGPGTGLGTKVNHGTDSYPSRRTPAWASGSGNEDQSALSLEEIFRLIQSGKFNFEQFKNWLQNYEHTVTESATAGATSSGSIASVPNPQLSPGSARGKKSYTGTPGHSGTKAPPQPKAIQPKNKDGTAKNGLDMKGSIFGAPIKR